MIHDWNYEDQSKWPFVYCHKAVAQSPIDLQINSMTRMCVKPLEFINWNQKYNISLTNNGHTIRADFPSNNISVSEGGLPGKYNIEHFHFHWASEHTVNGQRKALEAHFVGYDSRYKSVKEALGYPGGLAAIAVLYDYSCKDNEVLQPIVQLMDILKEVDQMIELSINPANLLPKNVKHFYRYNGSLTTPNCDEVVVWTVFSDFCTVSKRQVDRFRSILSCAGSPLTENFRILQPLNGRTVYRTCQ